MMAPGLPQIGEHFHETNSTIIAMSLSILLLAWVFSPLITAPLSEVYGREYLSCQVLTTFQADALQGDGCITSAIS
jgi:MFS family permease